MVMAISLKILAATLSVPKWIGDLWGEVMSYAVGVQACRKN
jgi:hypothetical protein